jgi:hypothetical protein
LLVWVRYLLSAERDTRDLPRCFVRYDQLITDWRTMVETVSERLGVTFPDRDPATAMEIDRFVRQDLRHHQRATAELLGRSDIADCLKQAFLCFSAAVETGKVDCAALDSIAKELDEAEAIYKRIRRRADSVSLHTISNASALPARRDALLALLLAEFGRANDTAERSKRVLDDIMASRSWRFTKAFRAFGRASERLLRRLRSGLSRVRKALSSR